MNRFAKIATLVLVATPLGACATVQSGQIARANNAAICTNNNITTNSAAIVYTGNIPSDAELEADVAEAQARCKQKSGE